MRGRPHQATDRPQAPAGRRARADRGLRRRTTIASRKRSPRCRRNTTRSTACSKGSRPRSASATSIRSAGSKPRPEGRGRRRRSGSRPGPAAAGRLRAGCSGWTCPVPSGSSFVDSWGNGRSGGRRHKGVDMMAPRGTPAVAPVSGTVDLPRQQPRRALVPPRRRRRELLLRHPPVAIRLAERPCLGRHGHRLRGLDRQRLDPAPALRDPPRRAGQRGQPVSGCRGLLLSEGAQAPIAW